MSKRPTGTGQLVINHQGFACLGIPTAATTTFTCNISLTVGNVDSNLGTTTGCLFVPGGGSICNYSAP